MKRGKWYLPYGFFARRTNVTGASKVSPSRIFLLLVCILLPALVSAQGEQPEDKIRSAIDGMVSSHPLRAAIFRISPHLIATSGYDSNALTSALVVDSDTFANIAPGADVALKLGRRGYISVLEDLNFVYYQNQSELRDIYNTTSGKFVTGSRKILLTVDGSYLSRIAPLNAESDQPVNQKISSAGANLDFSLSRRTSTQFHFTEGKSDFAPVDNVAEEIPVTPDYRSTEYGAGFQEFMGRSISLTADGSRGSVRIQPEEEAETTSDFYHFSGGIAIKGARVEGRVTAGYANTESTDPNAQPFHDLTIDTDVEFKAAKRLSIGGFVTRRRVVSALLSDNFLLNTEFGVRGSFPLAQRFFIDGRFSAGKNDYSGQEIVTGQTVTKDSYVQLDGGVNLVLAKYIVLRFNTTYQNRDSNVDTLTKDRTTFGVGLVMVP